MVWQSYFETLGNEEYSPLSFPFQQSICCNHHSHSNGLCLQLVLWLSEPDQIAFTNTGKRYFLPFRIRLQREHLHSCSDRQTGFDYIVVLAWYTCDALISQHASSVCPRSRVSSRRWKCLFCLLIFWYQPLRRNIVVLATRTPGNWVGYQLDVPTDRLSRWVIRRVLLHPTDGYLNFELISDIVMDWNTIEMSC